MEKQQEKYLKYLILLIEKELSSHPGYEDKKMLFDFLSRLKNSTNLLRDIYFISGIKNLELLSAYLIFVLKKAEEKQITFDNLLENIEEDKVFIKREVINSFLKASSLEIPDETEVKIKTTDEEEPQKQEWGKPEKSEETLETEFLEKETVLDIKKEIETAEDYIEEPVTEKKEEEIEHELSETLELIQQEENLVKENIFEVPDKVTGEEKEINMAEEPVNDKIFNIPEQKISEETEMQEIHDEKFNRSDLQKESKKSTAKKLKDLFHFKKQKETTVTQPPITVTQPLITSHQPPITSHQPPITNDQSPEDDKQVKKILIEPANEDYSDYNKTFYEEKETEEKEVLSESEKAENEIFNEYEKILRERNLIIAEGLNKIKDINDRQPAAASPQLTTEENEIIENIIADCEYMENYSRDMTFGVITNIYSTIKLSLRNLKEQNYRPDEEITDLFINAVILIQKLVSGDDYTGYENTVAEIEARQKELFAEKEKKERAEKIKKEKIEVEKKLEEKYSDTKDRKKLLLLKSKILSVEEIFKSLDALNGEFLTYEAHRVLSKTFPDFKHIVSLSNELKIENMAQLSEAAYIFIKYVQNYRKDPFGNEVKEILNYIIVNFKLLFLGKTSKDIEVFISYLNNPDKIFTEKTK